MTKLAWLLVVGLAACGGGAGGADAAPDIDATPPVGDFKVSWTITQGGTAATCEQVGATVVSVRFTPTGGGTGFPAVFDCVDGMGTTAPQLAGSYKVEATLKNGTGEVLATAPTLTDQDLVEGQTTTLASFTFALQ